LRKCNIFLTEETSLTWYLDRCTLIYKYFGHLSGSQLSVMQYRIDEYKNTKYREYIGGVADLVLKEYLNLFGEILK
jgi:hypothetical protein